jgi:hypothetical protein
LYWVHPMRKSLSNRRFRNGSLGWLQSWSNRFCTTDRRLRWLQKM